jgi:glutamyl-Q tRNA(Asp) synthetase
VRYVGRFAPSPTGPLHIGSLVTAVASFLHARQAGGEWLVRIEDIDPPRTVPGAADGILRTLSALGLHWDRSVLHQSTRFSTYAAVAEQLLAAGRAFRCSCSRSQLRAFGKEAVTRYPGLCRNKVEHSGPTSIRMRADETPFSFEDGVQGLVSASLAATTGDYVIYRRDELPGYHLAVVLDDADQGVTHIVRGVDLLESTFAHIHLQTALGLAHPQYFHLPVVVNEARQKLSKQTGAQPVDHLPPAEAAALVLRYLGLTPPAALRGAPPAELWAWARDEWDIGTLRGRRTFEIVATTP